MGIKRIVGPRGKWALGGHLVVVKLYIVTKARGGGKGNRCQKSKVPGNLSVQACAISE